MILTGENEMTKLTTKVENNGAVLDDTANQRVHTGESEKTTQVENNGAVLDNAADQRVHTGEENTNENVQLTEKKGD